MEQGINALRQEYSDSLKRTISLKVKIDIIEAKENQTYAKSHLHKCYIENEDYNHNMVRCRYIHDLDKFNNLIALEINYIIDEYNTISYFNIQRCSVFHVEEIENDERWYEIARVDFMDHYNYIIGEINKNIANE